MLLEDYQIALIEMKVQIILTARSDHLMVLIPDLSKCSRSSFCVLMLIQILTECSDCAHYNSYNHDNNWLVIIVYPQYIRYTYLEKRFPLHFLPDFPMDKTKYTFRIILAQASVLLNQHGHS